MSHDLVDCPCSRAVPTRLIAPDSHKHFQFAWEDLCPNRVESCSRGRVAPVTDSERTRCSSNRAWVWGKPNYATASRWPAQPTRERRGAHEVGADLCQERFLRGAASTTSATGRAYPPTDSLRSRFHLIPASKPVGVLVHSQATSDYVRRRRVASVAPMAPNIRSAAEAGSGITA